LGEKGAGAELEQVKREIDERDRRDSTRSDSPLVQAPDAELVDTTPHSLGQVEEIILKIVRERTSNGKEPAR
ncbi:MAG: cytidylate kinase, partial [bacterium]|nr:cytidylate kinase [bacterium]